MTSETMDITSGITSGCSYPNNTTWSMSIGAYIFNIITLLIEICTGILANTLLIVTISCSPSLNTPPNAHLVNICVNNLLLAIGALCSFSSLLLPEEQDEPSVLGLMQMFFSVTAFMQYNAIFAAIGYYRYKTVKKPTLSVRDRSCIISRTIGMGWVSSLLTTIFLAVTFRDTTSALSWNAFRRDIPQSQYDDDFTKLKSKHKALLYIILLIVIISIVIIIKSYHFILKTLYRAKPVGKNRVIPLRRSSSESSDTNDLFCNPSRTYRPESTLEQQAKQLPFVISDGSITQERFVVHYQKRSHSMSVDEVFALENPLKAQAMLYEKRAATLRPQLSNASQPGSGTERTIEFTDISPRGELQRFQHMKNKCALRQQSLKSERISLGSATKNSMIMLTIFIMCSLPGFICSFPGVLDKDKLDIGTFTYVLLYCQLLFYVNIPAYPIMYLAFSKRVRKCVLKLFDIMLIKLRLRR